jgi:hypothetical protein
MTLTAFALVILFTFLFNGAAYEAHRFVVQAWNYAIMVILYTMVSFYEWVST